MPHRILRIVCPLAIYIFFNLPYSATAQEKTGTLQQGLVGGTLVDQKTQEDFGLLTLTNPAGTCSASLLNAYWAITAAHCVRPASGSPPQYNAAQISLTANWVTTRKTVQALTVMGFANDVALVQVGFRDFYNSWGEKQRKLESVRPQTTTDVTAYGRGIFSLAFGSGAFATPTQLDGQYRSAVFGIYGIDANDPQSYSFSAGNKGAIIAGGDSGGPSSIQDWDDPNSSNRKLEWRLLGVHSSCQTTCLQAKSCAPPNTWTWVSSISSCTDAAILPDRDLILEAIQGVPWPHEFYGRFGTTPRNYQPIWLYAIKDDGTLLWYRKDTGTSAWQGPKQVGNGWQGFNDVFPAGGNRLYALAPTNALLWYQHQGFNDGASNWAGPATVGSGWNKFIKRFSGGDGVVYAIQADGSLLWYRHNTFRTGGPASTWDGPKVVGSGWSQFTRVFSMGQGIIYAVKPDGTLLWYRHNGYMNGTPAWTGPKTVGSGWQQFSAIIPTGQGVILAVDLNGSMLWYRHVNYLEGTSLSPPGRSGKFVVTRARVTAQWEGPVAIGNGWAGFRQIVALLPETAPQGPH